MKFKPTILLLIALVSVLFPAAAAPGQDGSISGKIISAEDGEPIAYAVVIARPIEVYATSDSKGYYKLDNLPAGELTISVEFIGYSKITQTVRLNKGQKLTLDFSLEEETFRLNEVTVVATASNAGKSTASIISRQAMDHLQTSSIKDVLSLLPGVAFSNPDLNKAQTITLRTNPDDNGGLAMNSLGTSIIVDGAPVSNNANLQTLSTSVSAGNLNLDQVGGSAPNTGIDLRSLSTDNIESIEVIRGIPSVEYGDLTSGAVIVKSKAGAMPLTVRFKTNPNSYQVSANKGLHAGKVGDINFGADFAHNTSSITSSYIHYERLNFKTLVTKSFGKLNTNTSLQLGAGRDRRDRNPDDETSATRSYANNASARLSSYGQLQVGGGFLKSLNYSISASYDDKHSYYETQATNAQGIYSTAMGNSTMTEIPGAVVTDAITGEPITSFDSGDELATATVTPYSYFSYYDIFGKEVNAYGKLVANFFHKFGSSIDSRTIVGADFKTDGNLGRGVLFPDDLPPLRYSANASSGYRERAYYDIPFVTQLGAFAEETWSQVILGRDLNLTGGVRYDHVGGLSSLAPRINASMELVPGILALRGGWGITSKAPTAAYLYPQEAYYDVINFSNKFQGRQNEMVIGTTKVFETVNPELKIATNRKAEVGLDLTVAGKYKLQVTAYDELMENGYSFGSDISSYIWTQYMMYKNTNPDLDGVPTPTLDKTYNIFFHYSKPLNDVYLHNMGLEYELNLGRFDAIRTSFYVNGAWSRTESSSSSNTFGTRNNAGEVEYNIGIYEPYLYTHCTERMLTTVRATHNLPSIGFVITLAGQVNWYGKSWTKYGNDEMFTSYISRKDGKVYPFDPAMKNDPEFRYMFAPLSELRFRSETTRPYVMFNINISKEIGNMLTASFFVNNVFNHRPLDEDDVSKGNFTELGIPMYFGMEINLKFK